MAMDEDKVRETEMQAGTQREGNMSAQAGTSTSGPEGPYERTVFVKKTKSERAVSGEPGRPGPRKRSAKKGLLIWGGIVAVIIVVAGLVWNSGNSDGLPSGPYIGTLYIEGEITGDSVDSLGYRAAYQHQWTLDQIDEMMDDNDNEGILMILDTPGGGVYESDEVYLKLLEYKEETGRPVYAAMGSMAASGGYYIAAAADEIYANRNTLTGSIGVTMGTQFDISGFLERYGIKTQNLVSGRNKAMGSMTEPLTEEQQAIYQSIIDDAYEQFVEIVAEGRQMPIERVKQLADGRIYTARQALDAGLVDAIGTEEEAVQDMMDEHGLWDCDVADITYDNTSLWDRFLTLAGGRGLSLKGDAAALLDYVNSESSSPISYLCEVLR